jgi:hypothetical protein
MGGFNAPHGFTGQFGLFQAKVAQRPVGLSGDLALFNPVGYAVAN